MINEIDKNILSDQKDKKNLDQVSDETWIESITSFDELNLKKDLLRGIYGYGFDNPSEIQSKAILPIIQNRDIIAQAQSGTGKTGAFVISTLQLVDSKINEIQALILSPTRELSQQSALVFTLIGEYTSIKTHAFIGGTPLKDNILILNSGVQIAVATPGRILDMLNKKLIKLDYLKILILDEADQMLSRGFLEEIKKIFPFIPVSSQIALFSATLPQSIIDLSKEFMNNPVKILLSNDKLTLSGIKQYYVPLKKEWKLEVLLNIYKMIQIEKAIIYANSKKTVNYLTEEMTKRNFTFG